MNQALRGAGILLLPILVSGCAHTANDHLGERLESSLPAGNEIDGAAVREVLKDCLSRPARYGEPYRQWAFEAVSAHRSVEFASLVARIAASSYRIDTRGRGDESDLACIRMALRTMLVLDPIRARDLSRRRLGQDSWLEETAIANLRELASWSDTALVLAALDRPGVTRDRILVWREALRFLAQSPETPRAACNRAAQIRTLAPECFRDDSLDNVCVWLSEAATEFERAKCSALDPPP